MTRRLSRLALLALTVCAAAFYFSCSQPDDIITAVARTDVYLTSHLLPTNPDRMMYELWVANAEDTVSLGKFGFHQRWLTYRDEDGNDRPDSNHFVLDGDIYSYSHMFVSVESIPDAALLEPGPIMLIDAITVPSTNPIELRFPLNDSLTARATAFFNMETPSDSDRTLIENVGKGIWFSAFYWWRDSVRDTLELDSFDLAYKADSSLPEDSFTTFLADIVNDTAYDTGRVFGLDTMWNTIVRFDSIIHTDTVWPYKVIDDTATDLYYETGPLDTFHYERFIQFDFGLPDYSSYGWKYQGWVVSPEVPVSAMGRITPPAYRVNTNSSDSLIPGIEGGLLTTGTFTDISVPDDGNPYSQSLRVPAVAGEDFLVSLPPELDEWQGLMPKDFGNSGTVFITLEPVNYVTDTTNFPLFVLIRDLPRNRSAIFQSPAADAQLFDMWNLTHTNDPNNRGFPKIDVAINRN